MTSLRSPTTEELIDQLLDISAELSQQLECPIKTVLSTAIERRVIEHVNDALLTEYLQPIVGIKGPDAWWNDDGTQSYVEIKATEAVPAQRTTAGRMYTGPTCSIVTGKQ